MTETAAPVRQHYSITLAALSLSGLAYALSQTLVAPALPFIQHALGATTTGATWVLTAYLLSASIATPIIGRLGDMLGKERVMLATLVAFGVGSLICALSHSLGLLIAGRVITGAGGAVFPLAFGIIRDEFPRERVAGAIGLISSILGIGGGLGLVLAGVIVEHASYEWIFWAGLAIDLVAIVATILFVPESPVRVRARIDWAGAALLSLGLMALLVPVSEGTAWGWDSVRVIGLLVVGVLILVGWVLFERRQPEPLVDMRMMAHRPVLTTNLTALLIGFGMYGSFILLPQFVQVPTSTGYGFGASVVGSGLFLLPSAATMLVAGPLSGRMADRVGSRVPPILGTMFSAVAFALLVVEHSSKLSVYLASAILGLGIGLAFAAMANLIVESVRQDQTGVATGINTIARTLGGSVGTQILAAVLAGNQLAHTGYATEDGFTIAFSVALGGVVASFLAALAVPSRRRAPVPVAAEGVRA
ncbi:MAG TPA: MFS transporter [Solirubrobacteraceae bacterium]